jgi:hypothetical protein
LQRNKLLPTDECFLLTNKSEKSINNDMMKHQITQPNVQYNKFRELRYVQPRSTFVLILVALLLSTPGCIDLMGPSNASSPASVQKQWAQRVEVGYLESRAASGRYGNQELYACIIPEDTSHYYNVFQMSGGHIIALPLRAKSNGGNYAGDELLVYDASERSNIRGWHHEIGGAPAMNSLDTGFSYRLWFRGDTAFLRDHNGPQASVSLTTLYRMRAKSAGANSFDIGDKTYYMWSQGGPRGALLFFPQHAVDAAENPNSTPSDLIPQYVVFVNKHEGVVDTRVADRVPIGDSGYDLIFDESKGYYVAVKANE